jgi:hypothetical protein
MEFTIKLQDADVRTVLEHLDMGQHVKVRRVIDNIFGQVQRQETEANKPADHPVTPAE